ncbi:MAG: transposase family protein [Candidatus Entotheonellia bacterium]
MSYELQKLRTFVTPLLPPTRAVRLTKVTMETDSVLLQLRTTAPTAGCPRCAVSSSSVHSRYQRHLTDLPWGTRPVLWSAKTASRLWTASFAPARIGGDAHLYFRRMPWR